MPGAGGQGRLGAWDLALGTRYDMIPTSMATQRYEALRGMDDILPGEVEKWQWLEEKARIFFEAHGFKEIRTPLLEMTELFARSVGEASDIVHKEMFSFEDRGGRNISLRPEMTASVARAVIEHGLLKTNKSLRLYYIGPMFRAERPQAGRKRQFHQMGGELVNEAGASADFESVSLLYRFLQCCGLKDLTLRLNNLGDKNYQQKSKEDLKRFFSEHESKLCPDCQWRLEKNVLRIFDCKESTCRSSRLLSEWKGLPAEGEDWKALTGQLASHKIPYQIKPRLVRGLDYYNGNVFEVAAGGLGAQDAVAGGGRYDGLYSELGGSETPCTGFSIGMERLLVSLEKQGISLEDKIRRRKIYLAPLETNCEVLGLCEKKAVELRTAGLRIETTPGEFSLSRHLKKANQSHIRFVLILGSDEMKKGKWTVKDLDQKEQTEVESERLVSYLQTKVSQ